jgi:Family of unknown function (DUF5767)
MEVVDLGLRDVEPISLNVDDSYRPSVNFGPGVELLMNEKKKSNYASTSVDLGDLDKLEADLNDLSQGDEAAGSAAGTKSFSFGNFGSWLGGGGPANTIIHDAGHDTNSDTRLGEATAQSTSGVNRSSDGGFVRLNPEVPLDYGSSSGRMNDREKRRKKRMMIKKLEEWYEKGIIKHTSHFNMDSVYEEVEDEYEGALEDKRKKDSIKIYGWWFMTAVNSIEYANAAFNPFDLNLDGWGEQVSEDLDSYEELFGELYQKYKGGKLAPELSLLLRLGFSAAVVNFTNKALSTATPAFNDVIRQSPELMKMFTNATVQSMSQASPGFNMASNMMNAEPEVNRTFGAPPPPVATKNQAPPPRSSGPPMGQMQFTRPDIMASRGMPAPGPMFRESGVDVSQDRTPLNQAGPGPGPSGPSKRPEMRGPQMTDLNDILSGLKVKGPGPGPGPGPVQETALEQQAAFSNMQSQMQDVHIPAPTSTILSENDSMISVTSLREMQDATIPKRARRKQRSDRNTVSLDI